MLGTQKEHEFPYPPGSFFIVPFDIFDWDISPLAIHVYCALAFFTDENGQCFPSRRTLSKMCGGVSLPTVDKALKELEDKILIHKTMQLLTLKFAHILRRFPYPVQNLYTEPC